MQARMLFILTLFAGLGRNRRFGLMQDIVERVMARRQLADPLRRAIKHCWLTDYPLEEKVVDPRKSLLLHGRNVRDKPWQIVMGEAVDFVLNAAQEDIYLDMYFGQTKDGTKLTDAEALVRAMAFRYQAYQRSLAGDEQAKKAVPYELDKFTALAAGLDESRFNVLSGIYRMPQDNFNEVMQEHGAVLRRQYRADQCGVDELSPIADRR